MTQKLPQLIKDDIYLEPYAGTILNRIKAAKQKEKEIAGNASLYSFASGHLYFGMHQTPGGWVIREWAPKATHIFLIGTFNNWEEKKEFAFQHLENGIWELQLNKD
ncbi:MAG: 1,4-alpha-glucan-branching enzyme, partial [Bacteroidota bacterium]